MTNTPLRLHVGVEKMSRLTLWMGVDLVAQAEDEADEAVVATAEGIIKGPGESSPAKEPPLKNTRGQIGQAGRLDIAGLMARWCHGEVDSDEGYDLDDGFIDNADVDDGQVCHVCIALALVPLVSHQPCRRTCRPSIRGSSFRQARLNVSELRSRLTGGLILRAPDVLATMNERR